MSETEDHERFSRLSRWLERRDLWRPRPFAEHRVAWEDDFPEVSDWLRSRSEAEVEELERSARSGEGSTEVGTPLPTELASWFAEASALCNVPQAEPYSSIRGAGSFVRVRARKLAQARALAAHLLPVVPASSRVIDWCGGRGALARVLACNGLHPCVVDRQPQLLEAVARDARSDGSSIETAQCDVTRSPVPVHVETKAIVGLHACGRLGTELFEVRRRECVPVALLAPCCPHRLVEYGPYRGRSAAGRSSGVVLDDSALRLSTAMLHVADSRTRRARANELRLRQGLDLALRRATGTDAYTPVGVLPRGTHRLPMQTFVEREFERRGLHCDIASWDELEREAMQRVHISRALGIVRALFQRPIELWTILDHVIAERERGARVRWFQFCDAATTPRNIAIEVRAAASR